MHSGVADSVRGRRFLSNEDGRGSQRQAGAAWGLWSGACTRTRIGGEREGQVGMASKPHPGVFDAFETVTAGAGNQ